MIFQHRRALTAPTLLCRLLGHKMRHRKFVASTYFKFAPQFEWVRRVSKEPWYGVMCTRCYHSGPSIRIYVDDGTLVWGGQYERTN